MRTIITDGLCNHCKTLTETRKIHFQTGGETETDTWITQPIYENKPKCIRKCRQKAISFGYRPIIDPHMLELAICIDTKKCTNCGECIKHCPKKAIRMITEKREKQSVLI